MFVLGITGGIGSGKTAVTDIFSELNIDVIDADIASRKAVEKGSSSLKEIEDHFGSEIILNLKYIWNLKHCAVIPDPWKIFTSRQRKK